MTTINNIGNTQMSTPLSSLPLKTIQEQEANIEDPLIQNVLKEFEEDYNNKIQPEQINESVNMISNMSTMPNMPTMQPQDTSYMYPPPMSIDNLSYKKNNTNFIDVELIKKSIILCIVILFLQKSNVVSLITKYVPEYLQKYFNGREFILYFSIIFIVLYAMMYFGFI